MPAPAGSTTPSSRSAASPSGISPSPHALSRGGLRASITIEDRLRRAASIATPSPTGPPPTIARSAFTAHLGSVRAEHLAQQIEDGHPSWWRERAGEEATPRLFATDLPARGTRQRTGPQHQHALGDETRPLAHGARDGLRNRTVVPSRVPRALDEQEECLALVAHDAYRRDTPRAQAVHIVEHLLNVLGRVVVAAQDDQVLRASIKIELVLVDEARVAGVEPAIAECRSRSLRHSVVAQHHGGTAHKHASHLPSCSVVSLVVDDAQGEPGKRRPQAHEFLALGGRDRRGASHEGIAIEASSPKGTPEIAERDCKCGFGEAIDGG